MRTLPPAASMSASSARRCGYLERRPAADDGRGRVLRLTERGLAFVGAIKEIVTGIEAEWSARLGAERFAVVKEALQELTQEPAHAADPHPLHHTSRPHTYRRFRCKTPSPVRERALRVRKSVTPDLMPGRPWPSPWPIPAVPGEFRT